MTYKIDLIEHTQLNKSVYTTGKKEMSRAGDVRRSGYIPSFGIRPCHATPSRIPSLLQGVSRPLLEPRNSSMYIEQNLPPIFIACH